MYLYLENASTAVSAASSKLPSRANGEREDVHLMAYGTFGGGTVALEILAEDGTTWISPSETTFTEPVAQIIDLWAGAVMRINVDNCTSVSVEVH